MENEQKIVKSDENKIEIPVSIIISTLALVLSVFSLVQMKTINEKISSLQNLEVQTSPKQSSEKQVSSIGDYEIISENIIGYPYMETSKEENGISVDTDENGSISLTGTAESDAVVFRLVSNDATVEYPLDEHEYVFLQGVDNNIFSCKCRIDLGLTKADGTTEIYNSMNNNVGNGEDIYIDNTDGKYVGIHAISLYIVGGFEIPNNYIFAPQLVEID